VNRYRAINKLEKRVGSGGPVKKDLRHMSSADKDRHGGATGQISSPQSARKVQQAKDYSNPGGSRRALDNAHRYVRGSPRIEMNADKKNQ